MSFVRGLGLGIVCCAFCCSTAYAEIGKASASPGEWFLGFNGGGGSSWGEKRQVYIKTGDTGLPIGESNFDEGTFYNFGLEAGYVLADPSSFVDRIELSADLRILSRDLTRDTPNADVYLTDGINVSGLSALGATALQIDANDDQRDLEFRLSFKNTLFTSESHVIIASVEPFLRFQDLDGKMQMKGGSDLFGERLDEVTADYYGLQFAAEIESPITGSVSLIGRAAAGTYYVDSDIRSRVPGGGLTIHDDEGAWGGRFGGAAGIKVPLYYAGASLSIVGTVDYLTDVATIDHISELPSQLPTSETTRAGFDDVLDVGARLGLIVPLK